MHSAYNYTMASPCSPYDPDTETVEEFIERFSMIIEGEGKKKSDTVLAAHLVRALPVQMVTDLQRRIAPTKLTETTFTELKENLLQAYTVRKSVVGASVNFFTYKQQPNQTIEEFSKELRFLASKCNFDQTLTLDRLLRDVFIAGISSSHVLGSVLQTADKLTFPEAVEKAKLVQQVREDAATLHQPQVARAHQITDNQAVSAASSNVISPDDALLRIQSYKLPQGYECMRCGARNKHHVNKCFAKSLECRLCHKIGHISKVCRSAGRRNAVRDFASANVHQVGGASHNSRADCFDAPSLPANRSAPRLSHDAHSIVTPTPSAKQTVSRASRDYNLMTTPSPYYAAGDREYESGVINTVTTNSSSVSQLHKDQNRVDLSSNASRNYKLPPSSLDLPSSATCRNLLVDNKAELNDPEHFLF